MIHSPIKKQRGTPKVIPDRESYHFNAECPLFMNTEEILPRAPDARGPIHLEPSTWALH
jgi:hypothetical protein